MFEKRLKEETSRLCRLLLLSLLSLANNFTFQKSHYYDYYHLVDISALLLPHLIVCNPCHFRKVTLIFKKARHTKDAYYPLTLYTWRVRPSIHHFTFQLPILNKKSHWGECPQESCKILGKCYYVHIFKFAKKPQGVHEMHFKFAAALCSKKGWTIDVNCSALKAKMTFIRSTHTLILWWFQWIFFFGREDDLSPASKKLVS